MRESIFFNSRQIRLIRWYGYLYRLIFEYGVRFFSGLLSVFLVCGLVSSAYFSDLYLREQIDTSTIKTQLTQEYQKNLTEISSFSGVDLHLALGAVKVQSGTLFSQENLLSKDGVVLPRLAVIDGRYADQLFASFSGAKVASGEYYRFFSEVLLAPLQVANQKNFASKKLDLAGKSLKSYFGLSCLDGAGKMSVVCGRYVEEFLDAMYTFDLFPYQQETEDLAYLEMQTSPLADEFFEIYQHFIADFSLQQRFCDASLKYLQYGGHWDARFDDMFRRCGEQSYEKYQFLRDFIAINNGIALNYIDAKVYGSQLLNSYKLYSLQQLFYKNLNSGEATSGLLQVYFAFLQELLEKESRANQSLLSDFSKHFTLWLHTELLLPYLRDNQSKLSSEERVALRTKLLLLNSGDRARNIKPLVAKTTAENASQSKEENQISGLSLPELFRASLPSQLALLSLKEIDAQQLVVQGVDKVSNLRLELKMQFDGVQFTVVSVKIAQHPALEEVINSLLKLERYSLLKTLALVQEHLALLTRDSAAFEFDLCKTLESTYKERLLHCDEKLIKIWSKISKNEKEEKSDLFTFWLQDGVLKKVQHSDPNFEAELLKELDFSKFRKDMTPALIEKILQFTPQQKTSEFGLKYQLLVNDRFNKYLQLAPEKVEIEGEVVKVFFEVKGVKFIGQYDIVNDALVPIALDFGELRAPLIVQRFQLTFKDDQREEITSFLLDPVEYLRKINARLVDRYFEEGKLVLEKKKAE